ncbi:hypothetical protein ACGF7U_14645 [Micromonospora sp. NPDC047670]
MAPPLIHGDVRAVDDSATHPRSGTVAGAAPRLLAETPHPA